MSRRRPFTVLGVRLTVMALLVVVACNLLPVDAITTAAAKVSPAPTTFTLGLDGDSALAVVDTAVVVAPVALSSIPIASVQNLGALSLQSVTLGACKFGWSIICDVGNGIKNVATTAADCASALATLAVHVCLASIAKLVLKLAAWALKKVLAALAKQMNQELKDSTERMLNYTLVTQLGKNRGKANLNFTPIIECSLVQKTNTDGTANTDVKACDSKWFTGQFAIMRYIGLLLIIPLLMMVVMQSIIRGSLFFLLRAFLVMLPVAVLGSVVITVLAQIMLNISDDMSQYIASTTTDPAVFGAKLTKTFDAFDAGSMGFFTVFWFLGLLLSMVIILIELLLREMGIYLTLIFAPLAFATLVYPPLVKWLKRAISLMLGLIFMKLFITAALSMGFAALASSVTQGTGAPDPDVALNQIIMATVVFLFAGFGGTKILQFTPSADAATNRIAAPGEVLGMGDYSQQKLGQLQGYFGSKVGKAGAGGGSKMAKARSIK